MRPLPAYPILLLLAMQAPLQPLYSQLSVTSVNSPVTQNFDALPTTAGTHSATGSIFAEGWSFLETGSSANVTYSAGNGSDNAGNTYSFGVAGQNPLSDRSFGLLQTGSLSSFIGLKVINNSAQTISSITVGYSGEVWRLSAGQDQLLFSYQVGNVALNVATGWTTLSSLSFTTPVTGTGAVDGNLAANRTSLTPVIITGLYLPPGATITLRWVDATGANSAGMGIDDFTLTLRPAYTGYFRSRSSGDWNALSTWETSNNQTTWVPATTVVPSDVSAGVLLLPGHTVSITENLVAGKITVQQGGKIHWTGGAFTLTDATGDDLILQGANSEWEVAGPNVPLLNGSATVRIGTGALLKLSGNNHLLAFHTGGYTYANGSIFDYSHGAAPAISGTFFSVQEAAAVPVFRYSSTLAAALGSAGATTIQGKVEIAAGRTFNLNNVTGTLTIRNGITGDGNFSAAGTAFLNGIMAEISGAGTINAHLTINGGCLTTVGSNKTFSSNKTLTVNGTLDLGNWQLSTLSGTANLINGSTGLLKTSNPAGLLGATGSFKTGSFSISFNAGSTVDYNSNTAQKISVIGLPPYQVLKVSGNGIKTAESGDNLIVQNSCHVHNGATLALTGASSENFYLNNSASLQVMPGGIFDNGGESSITSSGGTPTISIAGTFITRDQQGFTGTGSAIPSIQPSLIAGSTIAYSRLGDQAVQATHTYENLVFAGSGTKTPASAISLNGTLATGGSVILNGSSHTIGGATNNLTMTGSSRLIVGGTGSQPALGGLYTLSSGTTIEFANSNLTTSTIRQGNPIQYANVDVTGQNVSVPSTGITLQSGGKFTVKNGGVVKISSPNGLYGPSNAAILSTNTPTIDLQAGSTVEYNGGAQTLTTAYAYSRLTLAGSGEKTAAGSFTVAQALTRSGSASLGGNSPTFGANATLAYADASANRQYTTGLEWPLVNPPQHLLINLSGSGTSVVQLDKSREKIGTITLSAGALHLNGFDLALNGTLSGAGTLSGHVASSLTLGGGSSVLRFTQNADGSSNALKSLQVNSGTVTLENKLQLYGVLNIGGGTLNLNNQHLVLKSTASNTARVAERKGQLQGATAVTVERFVSPAYRRRWRLLTAPVQGTSLHAGWQEGRTWNGVTTDHTSPGYGTLITGQSQGTAAAANAKGFDFWNEIAGAQASVRRYQGASTAGAAAWVPLPSTLASNFNNGEAYLLFVRGDRSVTVGSGGTVVRAKGTLKEADSYSITLNPLQTHTVVGNPYASPLQFKKLYADNSTVIKPYFWIWQASLSYTGGYALVKPQWEGSSQYEVIPSGASAGAAAEPVISSGEGFFVMPASFSSGTTLTIKQSHKEGQISQISVLREPQKGPAKLYVNLFSISNDTAALLDGVLAQFEEGSSASGYGSIGKAANTSENLSFYGAGTDLQVFLGKFSDTLGELPLRIWNLSHRTYRLEIQSRDFKVPGMSVWLLDRYLGKEVPVLLETALTRYDFTVNGDESSHDPHRFRLLFRRAILTPLSLPGITFTAAVQNAGIKLEWRVKDEKDIKGYELEKGTTGADFLVEKRLSATAAGGPQQYSHLDTKPEPKNFYRLKITGTRGEVRYSDIIKIDFIYSGPDFLVYPNPVKNATVQMQFLAQPAGVYTLLLKNSSGQLKQVYAQDHAGGNGIKTVYLPLHLPSGQYSLEIKRGSGKGRVLTMIVVH